jgi:hypothetical protein
LTSKFAVRSPSCWIDVIKRQNTCISSCQNGCTTDERLVGKLAFAGPYLGDQPLLPFSLADGGSFTTVKPSQHLLTAINIIQRFLDIDIQLTKQEGGIHLVRLI